jgi:CRISPR/Cas system CSM-associated protein Csm3 (group 7 of RAMP superfamily)
MITLLVATITVEPGWAVGAVPLDDPALDRDVILDAHGHPWVPGSSLAGSLKAHLAETDRTNATSLETDLMGSRPPAPGERDADTEASKMWIVGTHYTPDPATAGPLSEIIGQTAIDRERGAAATTSLRYSRTVSTGGTITAYLRYDGTLTQPQLQTLAAWRPAIGRDRTTGAGRAHLRTLHHGTIDPATPQGMRTWLSHQGPTLFTQVATSQITVEHRDEPWLQIDLEIVDALLIGDPRPTGAARARRRGGRPLIPGSAWKGLIRSRVEYILRSLYGPDAACANVIGCGTCPTCNVFGHQGGRGRLAFADSPIATPTLPGSAPLPTAEPTVRTHVGIDRVTGGARDGALFQTAPVTTGQLTLRIDQIKPVDPWVHTAILHVLHDLDDGLIGIGSRVTRGMGSLRLINAAEPPKPLHIPNMNGQTAEAPS